MWRAGAPLLGLSGRVNTECASETLRRGELGLARSCGSGDRGGMLPVLPELDFLKRMA